ncbi:MAG: hypothetical protein ACLS28_23265 [Clostridium neonatale]
MDHYLHATMKASWILRLPELDKLDMKTSVIAPRQLTTIGSYLRT